MRLEGILVTAGTEPPCVVAAQTPVELSRPAPSSRAGKAIAVARIASLHLPKNHQGADKRCQQKPLAPSCLDWDVYVSSTPGYGGEKAAVTYAAMLPDV